MSKPQHPSAAQANEVNGAANDPAENFDVGEPMTVPGDFRDDLTDDLRDVGDWSDAGMGMPPGPSDSFATNVVSPAGDLMTTIGHIGRYALKSRIGEGGLGTVYAAHDPLLSRLIAIKTLSLNIPPEQRDAFNSLFFNEARAAAGLSHPNIVTVYDAGISDDNAYIAMELLSGLDLRQLRAEGWRPTSTQAALIVRRVADALAYAHGKGLIHRDVKPANIFMVGRTQPRVLDFGIARMAHLHDTPGDDEVAGGSPYYMAPEQVRHQPVDKRADVFSLGVVLYELLTDEKPFRGKTLSEINQAVIHHVPPMAHKLKSTVPVVLSEIAAKAMEKDPEKRHRSARSLSRELRQWLDENSAPVDGPVLTPRVPKPVRKPLPDWVLPGSVGLLAVAVVGSALWWGVSSSNVPTMQMAVVAAPVQTASLSAAPAAPPGDDTKIKQIESNPATAQVRPAEISSRDIVKSATAKAAPPPALIAVVATAAAVAAPSAMAKPEALKTNSSTTAVAPAVVPTVVPTIAQTTTPASATPSVPVSAPNAMAALKPPAPVVAAPVVVAQAGKETAAEKRARETAERKERSTKERAAKPTATAAATAPALATGTVRLAVSPWGQVEVDGKPMGTTPPLNELTLPEGRHQVTIRNDDFPAHTTTVTVTPGQPISVRHKFGS
jgi:eukaryotic-like serine/threonine-protein kinase